MSKKLYVGALASSSALFLLALGLFAGSLLLKPGNIWQFLAAGSGCRFPEAAADSWLKTNFPMLALVVGSGGVFLSVHLVVMLVLLYKMWSAIQDGHARATPRRALGFLLIPVYNFYWIFRVWGSFPADYNHYTERYQLNLPPLSSEIYRLYPVLLILSVIPPVGIFTLLPGVLVFLLVTARTCDALNDLAGAVRERREILRQIPLPGRAMTTVLAKK